MTKIMGIDPSTYLAMVVPGYPPLVKMVHFRERRGWARLNAIGLSVTSVLEELNPDVAYVEGYNLRNKFNLILMVEIGTMVRNALFRAGIEWWDVPPTTLKKWTTGSGKADKSDMAKAAAERWGFEHPSDDVVDAYSLAMLGQDVQLGEITPAELKITHGHHRT